MIKIGVSGDIGSFSEEAGINYAKRAKISDYKLAFLIDMEGVLAALAKGEIDIGIFPVVNNNSGLVRPAFEAMGRYLFDVIDEEHLDVSQCLLAKKFMPPGEISAIYSYTPAFNQCKLFLSGLKDVKIIDWGDTAKAARDLASGVINEDCAVIGSARAAAAYGLQVIASNLQDVKPNVTMFVVVKKH
ncbi:MAG TPA: prephenate dehydratase domain-containing protein [Aquella sp.]|nr:prephenate dehydratase domain-containing protein [Aquella sp.]